MMGEYGESQGLKAVDRAVPYSVGSPECYFRVHVYV